MRSCFRNRARDRGDEPIRVVLGHPEGKGLPRPETRTAHSSVQRMEGRRLRRAGRWGNCGSYLQCGSVRSKAMDMDIGHRIPRTPQPDTRLRCDTRGRHGSVCQELAARIAHAALTFHQPAPPHHARSGAASTRRGTHHAIGTARSVPPEPSYLRFKQFALFLSPPAQWGFFFAPQGTSRRAQMADRSA
jgi:hypothetical protein